VKIGVPREIKAGEYRVAMTPAGVHELVQSGHEVTVETGAGEGSSFSDALYVTAGAKVASTEHVWEQANLVLKVKEPLPAEYPRLRAGQMLFTYLHLAANKELACALIESGATCLAYETVETANGALPLLAPMSEIAGRLAAQAGAYFLEKPLGGRGLLLGGVAGVAPGHVVIIGGGIVGYNSALIAAGLGAQGTILERSIDRMRHLEEILAGRVGLVMSSTLQLEESVQEADLVIGAVLIPGAKTPKLLTRPMLNQMKPGAVFCDVAIDQGGCAETSKPTTHNDPIYVVDGVLHYCVANIPGAVPVTSTKALTNATLPYIQAIADLGLAGAVARDPALAGGVSVFAGHVTCRAVAESHGLEYAPLDELLPALPTAGRSTAANT
jgi:alanine dehydrogenase